MATKHKVTKQQVVKLLELKSILGPWEEYLTYKEDKSENLWIFECKTQSFMLTRSGNSGFDMILKLSYYTSHKPFPGQTWDKILQGFKQFLNDAKEELDAEELLALNVNDGFPAWVSNVSPRFQTIFNQASRAEKLGLTEICGLGFRRAFETLVKDFIIHLKPDEPKEEIIKTSLGSLIKRHFDNDGLKVTATRTAWLGNDHAHYIKKWEDKDLNDLKNLIAESIKWMDMVENSKNLAVEMPD